MPQLAFDIASHEADLLDPQLLGKGSKNISYHQLTHELRGTQGSTEQTVRLKTLLTRFADAAQDLVHGLFPAYREHLQLARTSLRPAEIAGRISPSYRKDDTRLHVDAFPANPNQGRRILRVFANINPTGQPRIWRLGEPFEQVAKRFLPKIKPPVPGSAWLLETLQVTKSRRTLYDHYMLQIHDQMKADQAYQATAHYEEVAFPAGSTWIVQTDQVSHAALAGQHILEQTFYLPVSAMLKEELSPFKGIRKIATERFNS